MMAKRQNYERTKTIPILKFSLEKHYKNGFYYKPPDDYWKGKTTKFEKKKPFDIIYIYDGSTVGIEAKYIGEKTFVFSSVEDHQIANLKIMAKNGYAYIAIHYKKKRQESLAFIEIYDFIHLKETYHKKSMRWEEVLKDKHFSFILDVDSYDIAPGEYKKFVNFYGTYLLDE
jgi:hypothetical protein